MTTEQRKALLEMVTELTNNGEHQAAKVLYDEVMHDYRKSQAR